MPYVPAGPVVAQRYSKRDGVHALELLGELEVRVGAEQRLDLP